LYALVEDHQSGGAVAALDVAQLSDAAKDLRRKTFETLMRADDDYGRRLQFNTVVSSVMELCNAIGKFETTNAADRAVVDEALKHAVLIISPIAPHVAHHLWHQMGETGALVAASWPSVDEQALTQSTVEIVVQVNGKVRGKIDVAADADKDVVLGLAKSADNVARHLEDKTIRKEIVIPNKLVNIVVS
jgi:leucyl-tRNA synthetase